MLFMLGLYLWTSLRAIRDQKSLPFVRYRWAWGRGGVAASLPSGLWPLCCCLPAHAAVHPRGLSLPRHSPQRCLQGDLRLDACAGAVLGQAACSCTSPRKLALSCLLTPGSLLLPCAAPQVRLMGPLLVAVVLCTILLGFIPVVVFDSCNSVVFRALPLRVPFSGLRVCACQRLAAGSCQRRIAAMPAPFADSHAPAAPFHALPNLQWSPATCPSNWR